MSSLYDLTGDYARFAEYMETVDLDVDLALELNEALSNLSDDIDDKLENYAKIIANFEGDIASIAAEEARLEMKRKTLENSIKRMKLAMRDAILSTTQPDEQGRIKRKGTLFSFTVRRNQPAVVMDCQDIDLVPEKYLIPQEPKIDRKLLKEDLQNEALLPKLEGIAHLEQSQSVIIK